MAARYGDRHSFDRHLFATATTLGILAPNANADVDDDCSDADALLYAFDADAYAVADDDNADAKMPNDARHLAGAYDVVLMPTLMRLLRQSMFMMMQWWNVCKGSI